MTTISKTELQSLKQSSDENEKSKDDVYQLNIKLKKLDF